MKKIIATATAAILLIAAVPPIYGGIGAPPAFADSVDIQASGATFAFPLMDLWRVEYRDVQPDVTFDYQSIGSGGGVRNHIANLVDFAATDAPLTDAEYGAAPGTITIPAMIGAISIVYNIPGVPESGLNLSEEALCGIFLGTIDSWDDSMIARDNPELRLPDEGIVTVHRSDGSGTTFALTSYLTKTCPAWDERVGAAKSVQWPGGLGSPGNEGVAGTVRTTENSVGYVTLAYAAQNGMQVANIQNGDKTAFVPPAIDTASAASAAAAFWLPGAGESWRDVDLLAAPGIDSYPITSFSYILLHPDLERSVDSMEQATAAADLIAWMITDGQRHSPKLQYVPIADLVSNIGLRGLAQVTYDGNPVYTGPTNVWEGGPRSDLVDTWIEAATAKYRDGEISQSAFLQTMSQAAQLHGMYGENVIDDSRLQAALENILP